MDEQEGYCGNCHDWTGSKVEILPYSPPRPCPECGGRPPGPSHKPGCSIEANMVELDLTPPADPQ